MKRTLIQEDAIATTYEDMEKLIYDTVHKFIRAKGGSFDELVEHTSISFMHAYEHRNHSKGKFTTYLRWCIWHDLLTVVRNRARHAGKVVFTDLDPEAFEAQREFNKVEFLDALSDDAWFIAKCVLDTPRDLRWLMVEDPSTIRVLMREYLRALKWAPQRISQAFVEIRETLSGKRPFDQPARAGLEGAGGKGRQKPSPLTQSPSTPLSKPGVGDLSLSQPFAAARQPGVGVIAPKPPHDLRRRSGRLRKRTP